MAKRASLVTILFLIILSLVFWGFKQKNQLIAKDQALNSGLSSDHTFSPTWPPKEQTKIILYYGIGCPHCAKVEEFIQENKIKEKIDFEEKEVYYDYQNALDLQEKAKKCALPLREIGVPFLWDGSKCFIGDEDIIQFFTKKISS